MQLIRQHHVGNEFVLFGEGLHGCGDTALIRQEGRCGTGTRGSHNGTSTGRHTGGWYRICQGDDRLLSVCNGTVVSTVDATDGSRGERRSCVL